MRTPCASQLQRKFNQHEGIISISEWKIPKDNQIDNISVALDLYNIYRTRNVRPDPTSLTPITMIGFGSYVRYFFMKNNSLLINEALLNEVYKTLLNSPEFINLGNYKKIMLYSMDKEVVLKSYDMPNFYLITT